MNLNEKNIFLLDGAGALVSALTTGIILPLFFDWTRLPISISSGLGLLGLVFAVYSLSCYFFVKQTKPVMLAAIIVANFIYCAIAIGLALYLNEITFWGRAYFVIEVFVILGVVAIELAVYRRAFAPSL